MCAIVRKVLLFQHQAFDVQRPRWADFRDKDDDDDDEADDEADVNAAMACDVFSKTDSESVAPDVMRETADLWIY